MIQGKVEGSFNRAFQIASRLETIRNYTTPLLEAWSDVLVEDNRRGVMQGIDGDGNPMTPTKYRRSITQAGAGKAGDKFFNAQGQAFSNIEISSGFLFANLTGQNSEGFKPGPGANKSTREYRRATGPPLAPFGAASRVISNYMVEAIVDANMVGVEGGWNDIVSKTGFEFLPVHFRGSGIHNAAQVFARSIGGGNFDLPRRNLVGLRQWGKSQARKELNTWVEWLLTQAQLDYFQRSSKHTPKYVRLSR